MVLVLLLYIYYKENNNMKKIAIGILTVLFILSVVGIGQAWDAASYGWASVSGSRTLSNQDVSNYTTYYPAYNTTVYNYNTTTPGSYNYSFRTNTGSLVQHSGSIVVESGVVRSSSSMSVTTRFRGLD
jgi:hypothetical protein